MLANDDYYVIITYTLKEVRSWSIRVNGAVTNGSHGLRKNLGNVLIAKVHLGIKRGVGHDKHAQENKSR